MSSSLLDSPARGFQQGSRGEALSKVVDGGGRGDEVGLDSDGWIDGNKRRDVPYIHYATCPVISSYCCFHWSSSTHPTETITLPQARQYGSCYLRCHAPNAPPFHRTRSFRLANSSPPCPRLSPRRTPSARPSSSSIPKSPLSAIKAIRSPKSPTTSTRPASPSPTPPSATTPLKLSRGASGERTLPAPMSAKPPPPQRPKWLPRPHRQNRLPQNLKRACLQR